MSDLVGSCAILAPQLDTDTGVPNIVAIKVFTDGGRNRGPRSFSLELVSTT